MSELNLLIDMIDSIGESASPSETWDVINGLFEAAGSPFLGLGELDQSNGEFSFAQSSMRRDWVDRWVDRDYLRVDPHVPRRGVAPRNLRRVVTLASDRERFGPDSDPLARGYHEELVEAGYGGVVSVPCPVGNTTRVRLVAFGAGVGDEAFMHSDRLRSLILFAPFVALHAAPLDASHDHSILNTRARLSTREKDVLCLLANGLMNARIADRLGITEPTVRKHICSARRKLGSATREQAVAMALSRGLISI